MVFTNQHHGVGNLADKNFGRVDPRTIVELILAEFLELFGSLSLGQTIETTDAQFFKNFLESQGMGGLGERFVGLSGLVVREELGGLVAHVDEVYPGSGSCIKTMKGSSRADKGCMHIHSGRLGKNKGMLSKWASIDIIWIDDPPLVANFRHRTREHWSRVGPIQSACYEG